MFDAKSLYEQAKLVKITEPM